MSVEGCVTYHARTRNFLCAPVEIKHDDVFVFKITVESFHDNFAAKIEVWFRGNHDEEQARIMTDPIALSTLDQLARHTNNYFETPICTGYGKIIYNPDGTKSHHDIIVAKTGVAMSANINVSSPQTEADKIKAELEKARGANDENFYKYREALISSDPVASFMYLYQVLMSYHYDNMDETDKYIHKQLPELEYKANRRHKRDMKKNVWVAEIKTETAYTRLRNQIGHNRLEATPASTRNEVQAHLGGLMGLVKKCIEALRLPDPPQEK